MGLHERNLSRQTIGPRSIIGIEPSEIGCVRCRNAEIEGRNNALRWLTQDADATIGARKFRQQPDCVVVGAIVDDQQLELAKFLAQNALNRLAQPLGAVAHRHDYRYDRDHRGNPFSTGRPYDLMAGEIGGGSLCKPKIEQLQSR
jgi:hypothetical protein